MDSLPAKPQGKPKNTRVGSLSLLFVLPNPDTKQGSPALQVDSLPTELPGKPFNKLYLFLYQLSEGFSSSSVGKEYTCNAGEPGSVPWSRRSAGEGIGYALLYSWASLVA